ncbi:MAG: GNAT family N-acetyltransferase [Actinomycetota bacterium]|nr:GNAT family N-acetyltransferase [Actinomycetota bacterium]
MKRELSGGYELDDDPARIDIDAVHDFVSNHSYWAPGRSRQVQEELIAQAIRVVALYRDGEQVGFARAVGDSHLVYLADVYVLPEHRGRGLGVELLREMIDNGPYAETRWMLHTADAHKLYERFGFGPASDRVMERARRT